MTDVLLIDQDAGLSQMLAAYLEAEGFRVRCAADAEAALAAIQAAAPAVIVLDLMPPDRTGIEVLKAVRSACRAPVLMSVPRGELLERIEGLELGADDYLATPCPPRELVQRLRALTRPDAHPVLSPVLAPVEAPVAASFEDKVPPIDLGGLTLDPARREVLLLDVPLPVTGTEYRLLEALARDPGKAVSKAALAQAVLGRPPQPYDHDLDLIVRRLHRRLQPRSPIRVAPGEGYAIVTEP